MRSIAVRELTGSRLRQAAEDQETLAVTNDRVLTAVLLPVQQRLLDQLVDRNLSEIVHGVILGETPGDVGTDVDDLLDEPQHSPLVPRPTQRIVPVSIRELSAARITEAAERKETLGITSNRVLVALLIPLSQRWVEYIVQANLSRLIKGVQLGEAEAVRGLVSDVGEDLAEDESPEPYTIDVAVRPVLSGVAEEARQDARQAAW